MRGGKGYRKTEFKSDGFCIGDISLDLLGLLFLQYPRIFVANQKEKEEKNGKIENSIMHEGKRRSVGKEGETEQGQLNY